MTLRPFEPTHKLIRDIPELRLKIGTLVRQVNPLAEKENLLCYDENDWNNNVRIPWILTSYDLEPLDTWPIIRRRMIDSLR
jgi:hypothetical protein